jgi:hypothetical protein
MGDGTVLAAYVHPATEIQHSFATSLMAAATYDAAHNRRLYGSAGPLQVRCGTGGLVDARNTVMRYFLDETADPWLWMVDTDMGFAADTVDRLVEAADPVSRPVLGALCFSLRQEGPDGMGGFLTRPVPTIYDWGTDPLGVVGFAPRRVYERDAVVRCAGTGAACLLVHRDAAAKVRAEHGDSWFDPVRYQDGRLVSEDLSFCYRLGMADIPLHVHTGVRTTHAKVVWLSERDYLAHLTLTDAAAVAEATDGT